MTVYPGAIDAPALCENDAVHAIETTLGVNPQGGFNSVVDRLNILDVRLAAERAFRVSDYGGIQQAINAAFAAGGGFVVLPWGVYTLPGLAAGANHWYDLRQGVQVVGFGRHSTLKVPNGAGNFRCIFLGVNLYDVELGGFCLDGNQAGNAPTSDTDFEPVTGGWAKPREAIHLDNGARVTISDLHTANYDNRMHIFSSAADITIERCHFDSISTFDHDHSSIYTEASGARILNNVFTGNNIAMSAIETHGSDQYVRGNTIRGFRRGMNITSIVNNPIGAYAVTIKDNHVLDCEVGISLWSSAYGSDTDNQRFADLIVKDNIIRPNKALWPAADFDHGIYFHHASRPYFGLLLSDNLVRVLS